jgi:hypothetical protein
MGKKKSRRQGHALPTTRKCGCNCGCTERTPNRDFCDACQAGNHKEQ